MKICILTQPLHVNYGGLLQAYALQKVLRRMGHEVVTDRYGARRHMPLYKRTLYFGYHLYKRCLLKDKRYMPFDFLFTSYKAKFIKNEKQVGEKTELFIDSNIATTNFFAGKPSPSTKSLNMYDALIIGSDQVWRPSYSHVSSYFLDFANLWKGKKIAYAASFGLDNWDEFSTSLTSKCSMNAKNFTAISVREESGIQLCKDYLESDATLVLDPTLLLDKEDYLELIEERDQKEQAKIMMCYILDQSKEKQIFIESLARKKGLFPVIMMAEKGFDDESYGCFTGAICPSISKWISGFRDAEFVVTDSFHGTIFSILFQKQFIVIGNQDRGIARFYSLLNLFDLKDTIVFLLDELDFDKLRFIEYDKVVEKMIVLKNKSLDFLKNSLEL